MLHCHSALSSQPPLSSSSCSITATSKPLDVVLNSVLLLQLKDFFVRKDQFGLPLDWTEQVWRRLRELRARTAAELRSQIEELLDVEVMVCVVCVCVCMCVYVCTGHSCLSNTVKSGQVEHQCGHHSSTVHCASVPGRSGGLSSKCPHTRTHTHTHTTHTHHTHTHTTHTHIHTHTHTHTHTQTPHTHTQLHITIISVSL